MAYFDKFPRIIYSFDSGNAVTGFVMTDILRRVKADAVNLTNTLAYDEYDVRDGETPEIVADKVYNNADLHWVVLIANEIIDPRFDWPLNSLALDNYITDKYGAANVFATHHYENSSGDTVYYRPFTGTASIGVTSAGTSISVAGTGTAFLTELTTGKVVRFGTTTTAYTVTAINSNTSISVSGAAVLIAVNNAVMLDNNSTVQTVTRITNTDYEISINEAKRRIQLIKPQFVSQFIHNFTGLLSNGD